MQQEVASVNGREKRNIVTSQVSLKDNFLTKNLQLCLTTSRPNDLGVTSLPVFVLCLSLQMVKFDIPNYTRLFGDTFYLLRYEGSHFEMQ